MDMKFWETLVNPVYVQSVWHLHSSLTVPSVPDMLPAKSMPHVLGQSFSNLTVYTDLVQMQSPIQKVWVGLGAGTGMRQGGA